MKTLLKALQRNLLVGLFAVAAAPANAALDLVGDDTDLFMRNPNIPSSIPNVLIVLDNTSNWAAASGGWDTTVDPECKIFLNYLGSTQGNAEVCALYRVIKSDKLSDNVRVGLMMYHQQGGSRPAGGYIRSPMLGMSDANKITFTNILKNVGPNSPLDKSPSSPHTVDIFNDAFRYFNSFSTLSGVQANSPGGPEDPPANAGGYVSGSNMRQFNFPAGFLDNSCGDDHIIFIGNGPPSSDNNYPWATGADGLTGAAALLNDPSVQPDTSVILNTGFNFDVWARFLNTYGTKIPNTSRVYRKITTHTINVCNNQCTQNIGWVNWGKALGSAAGVSGGLSLQVSDLEQLVLGITSVFNAIQAKDSVFAATTLPVSINVRGTNLNQVYIGVFKPDANLSPRWWGNLKQYQLGLKEGSTTELELKQADGTTQAVNISTGFIYTDATSIWSEAVGAPGSQTGFWKFRGPPYKALDEGKDQDAPDGDLVEKGGAAQKIRQVYDFPDSTGPKTRKIYTCVNSSGNCGTGDTLSTFPFNDGNTAITSTTLGTFLTTSVDSITASGTTATVTINAGHSFVVNDQVVIGGANPDLYNSPPSTSFTVLASPAPTATQFSYTLPSAPDTSRAYVTFAAPYTLTPGTDLVTVTGALPVVYNVTNAAISAVSGNTSQFSYALASSTTSPATGYTVTGVRRVQPGNLVYSTATGRATVTLNSHGYGNLNLITIEGATPSEFNGLYSITNDGVNTFSYVPVSPPAGGTVTQATAVTAAPSGFNWQGTDIVSISNGGSSVFNTATTPAPGGSTISLTGATTFTYTTGGSPTAGQTIDPATGFMATRISVTDKDTWTPANPVFAGSGANRTITLSLSGLSKLVTGQLQHAFANGDSITVNGLTCQRSNGNSVPCRAGGTAGETTFTTTITAFTNGSGTASVTFAADNNAASGTWQAPQTVVWSASAASPSFSAPVAVSSLVAGQATVTATGTIYASKPGDLSPTSIASQGTATGSMTVARFGSSDAAERTALINWVRGFDNKDNENLNGDPTDIRASVHGDVLHSRPAVINYNRVANSNDDVYVFYGANDGMLHAIKGGSLAGGGGKEQWAFVAPEFFGKLKRLRDQLPRISSLTPRNYFFDGSIAVYTRDAGKDGKIDRSVGGADVNDKAYLFVTMRRGGRMLYAFDVTDPVNPVFKWKKGCREATGSGTTVGTGDCDAGFGEMAQTWGQPQLGYLRKWPTTLALIVGAGYDRPVEDFQPCVITDWNDTSVTAKTNVVLPTKMDATSANCPPSGGTSVTVNRSQGRGVFILNAETGDILWSAGTAKSVPANSTMTKQVSGMDYSIVGDIAALRNKSNTANRVDDLGFESVPLGYFDRLYATDTGGNVWRFDVADTATPPNFLVNKLAAVAEAPGVGTHAALNYRKFTVQTDVVYGGDANGVYDAVLVGSGDREHVWDFVVTNRFYMFKDRKTGTLTAADPPLSTIMDSTTDLYDANTVTVDSATLLARRGWRLTLGNVGEKTVAPATTAAGTVIFNTHQPVDDDVTGLTTSACTAALGTARQYGISYKDATSMNIFSSLPDPMVSGGGAIAKLAGGGFLPQPVPAVVEIGGNFYQTVIAGVQTTNPGGLTLQNRVRTYWFRRTD